MNQLHADSDVARSASAHRRGAARQNAPPQPSSVVAIELTERDTANIPSRFRALLTQPIQFRHANVAIGWHSAGNVAAPVNALPASENFSDPPDTPGRRARPRHDRGARAGPTARRPRSRHSGPRSARTAPRG